MSLWLGMTGLVLILMASLFGEHQHRARERLRRVQFAQVLRDLLDLLQLLQKHRGLGGQDNPAAQQQRREVARQLDRLWSRWPDTAPELPAVWPNLREQPQNFAAHSRAIEALLSAIALTEQRMLLCSAGSAAIDIATSCHRLEDLARLRGLSARAAAQTQCPLDLQVQLRYLCERLRNHGAGRERERVRQALLVLEQKLLDAKRVTIAPAACFELITPIIDDGVAALQRRMAV